MQPYYKAYTLIYGENQPLPNYIKWIKGKHKEFKLLHNIPTNSPYPAGMQEEFEKWLTNKLTKAEG